MQSFIVKAKLIEVFIYWLPPSPTYTQKSEGGGECEQLVSVGNPISLITIDKKYGLILAAVHNVFR